MGFFGTLAGYAVPVFLITSPVLSYADQGLSMYRTRSSAGFSLDIPLIMLVSSICKIFYYPGARYDTALLVQAFVNIITQTVLLKIALDYRPSRAKAAAVPFAEDFHHHRRHSSNTTTGGGGGGPVSISALLSGAGPRPYGFWQWRSPQPYWRFLLSLLIALVALELLLAPAVVFPRSVYGRYSDLLGYAGLAVEATLALPQLAANMRARSCRGFRPSLLASWLVADAAKMAWFFASSAGADVGPKGPFVPWPFKLCGVFQAACDVGLGVQYAMYGGGEARGWEEKRL